MALADAEETRRARDVIAAHKALFDDEDDVALMLEQAAAVMAEYERVRGQLSGAEWIEGDRSLPGAIDDLLAFTAEAERAYGALFDYDLLPPGTDLPGVVQALIAETVQVRAELGEAGYSCWTLRPAETVRELISDAAQADALEQRYLRERRRSQQMADIARRALTGAHDGAHAGSINACLHCAADWAQLPQHDHVTVYRQHSLTRGPHPPGAGPSCACGAHSRAPSRTSLSRTPQFSAAGHSVAVGWTLDGR